MKAVVLIGHGGVPKDFSPEKVGRLKALEAQRQRLGLPMNEEERILDEEIRSWPRTQENDPFFWGMQEITKGVQQKIGATRLQMAFNEFCGPSIETACEQLIGEGFTELVLISTMLTRGGVHSEFEIPEIIDALRTKYPSIKFHYQWPYNIHHVSDFFAAHLSM